MALRQYLAKAHYVTGHKTFKPGQLVLLNEEDATDYVREGTLEPVKDAETLRREGLFRDLKAAANAEDLDAVFAALTELMPAPAKPVAGPAPEDTAKAKRA